VLRGGRVGAHRVVDVVAEGIGFVAIAVEQRRIDAFWQGGAEEARVLRQRFEDDRTQRLRDRTCFRKLAVVFDRGGLAACGNAAVGPVVLLDRFCGRAGCRVDVFLIRHRRGQRIALQFVDQAQAGFTLCGAERVVLRCAGEQQRCGGLIARTRVTQHDQGGNEK